MYNAMPLEKMGRLEFMKLWNRMLILLGMFVILCPIVPAFAQTNTACERWITVIWINMPPPDGFYCPPDAQTPGLGIFRCRAYSASASCPVSAAAQETCTSCSGGKSAASGGSPINLANGNTYIIQNDFAIPGLSGGLSLTRTWNSKWPVTQNAFKNGLFGPNWRSTYEERIFMGDDGYLKYARSDGSFWSFAADFSGGGLKVAAPSDENAILSSDASTTWTVTFKNGTRRTFDYHSGWLKSIVDRNGNTTAVSYDGNNRIITVTDPANRTIIFNYPNSTSLLISSVVSALGTFTYSYDPQGRLIKVTRPDNTFTTFEYDTNSLISAVKDTDGKLLEGHTYDAQGRGLTSTRANGVDAITVSYPNDTSGLNIINPH
jgi:YD repeat-containing protein